MLDRYTTHRGRGHAVATTDWTPLFFLLAAMYLGSGVCWLLIDCTQTIQKHGRCDTIQF